MDTETLVDQVTKIIMQRLGENTGCPATPSVVTFGEVPSCLLQANARPGFGPADTEGADYIVLSQAAFKAFHGGTTPAGLVRLAVPDKAATPAPAAGCPSCGGASFDLSAKRIVGEADVKRLDLASGATVRVGQKAIVTALARDYVTGLGAQIVR